MNRTQWHTLLVAAVVQLRESAKYVDGYVSGYPAGGIREHIAIRDANFKTARALETAIINGHLESLP